MGRLGDLAQEITVGHVGPMLHEYVPGGIPFLRSLNVQPYRVTRQDLKFISPGFHERISKSRLRPGDVVIVRTGKPGTAAVVPNDLPEANCSDLVIVRPGECVDARYLVYFVNSAAGQQRVGSRLVGAVQQHFNIGEAREMVLPVPGLQEQRAISGLLGALDDKIDLNRRMNETLEAMARTLFRSWFRSLNTIDTNAAELIQEGVLEIGDGYRAKNEELGEPGLPFIRAADLKGGFDTDGADRLMLDSVARAGTKISEIGDVAFTSKGTIGRFARVGEQTNRFVYSPQVCFWRSRNPSRLHPALLYCWMQTGTFMAQVLAVAGQTDMAPYVSLKDQRQMKVPVLPPTQMAIGETIEPLLARQSLNGAESRTLAAIRDALLPKLISGEIRVGEAERAVGSVL